MLTSSRLPMPTTTTHPQAEEDPLGPQPQGPLLEAAPLLVGTKVAMAAPLEIMETAHPTQEQTTVAKQQLLCPTAPNRKPENNTPITVLNNSISSRTNSNSSSNNNSRQLQRRQLLMCQLPAKLLQPLLPQQLPMALTPMPTTRGG